MKHTLIITILPLFTLFAADNTELSRQATDPTASLMALNFQSTWVGSYHGATPPGEANDAFQFAFRPVIPFEALGKPNILRLTMPYQLGSGWSLSAGDLQFTYDWKASRWINLPLGFQLGKVMKLGGLPSRFAINPQ